MDDKEIKEARFGLDDRLQVQKFVLVLYCIGEDIWQK